MDEFELKPEPPVKKRGSIVWNLLTILTLLGTCCLAYYFYLIYSNPNAFYNPFPPAVLPTAYQSPTPTDTAIPLPPTWTPTFTKQPLPSRTKAPTWTPLGGQTATTTETPAESVSPATLSPEEILTVMPTQAPVTAEFAYQASTLKHPDAGCDWMGVGGEVFDANGNPLQFQTVHLGGTLAGETIDREMRSGSVPSYGGSGFEFLLGNHPVASTQDLWIQLFDFYDNPVTDKIFFDTYADCNRNLVMVTFTKTP